MAEHSDRARYVTDQVKLWIANDGQYVDRARELANASVRLLSRFLTSVIRQAQPYSAPWHVAQELAPNDWDRIRWDDVAHELKD